MSTVAEKVQDKISKDKESADIVHSLIAAANNASSAHEALDYAHAAGAAASALLALRAHL